jgi:hypothetical protein
MLTFCMPECGHRGMGRCLTRFLFITPHVLDVIQGFLNTRCDTVATIKDPDNLRGTVSTFLCKGGVETFIP